MPTPGQDLLGYRFFPLIEATVRQRLLKFLIGLSIERFPDLLGLDDVQEIEKDDHDNRYAEQP